MGLLESLVFIYPYASCNISRPSATLEPDAHYALEAAPEDGRAAGAGCGAAVAEYLQRRGYSADSMNREFNADGVEYEFGEMSETVDPAVAVEMFRYNLANSKLLFDGRIFYGARRVAGSAEVPAGWCRMVLQGTLMADRCSEPFNCQILITIPCMLESLLASRECASIKYIIIDEVHKINDEAIGLSIERIIHLARCPLLLLSATIGNLDEFYKWFGDIESAKGREHTLVMHSERFCELKPYVYRAHPRESAADNTGALGKLSVATGDEPGDEGARPGHSPLLPLNCMVAYSFSHVKEFGFGNDITFLPEEQLNLYYYIYMVLNADQKKLIKRLAPKKFFKSNIICKADTREYQRHLLSTFESWVQEGVLSEDQVKEVYNLLVGDTLEAFPTVSTEEYLVSNMLSLLSSLKEQDMLPVIIFNMDREFVTRLAKAVYLELESQDLRKKKDKMLEKIKKENKRNRDAEKTRDSWIEESIASEQSVEPEARDMRYTFLDQSTRLSDAEVREELADVRGTPKFATDMVYRGIGIHHAAMERKYRSAVEILFRKKHVRVLFATETLALGINMPCRTVVFAGDSLALDPMNYKQMAGRAGRRGYDTLGNVVFMGIPRCRVQNLMVSMLPRLSTTRRRRTRFCTAQATSGICSSPTGARIRPFFCSVSCST